MLMPNSAPHLNERHMMHAPAMWAPGQLSMCTRVAQHQAFWLPCEPITVVANAATRNAPEQCCGSTVMLWCATSLLRIDACPLLLLTHAACASVCVLLLQILILPMCADDICNAQFVTPSCDPAVTDGNFQCKFQADRLPVASGIVLALFYSSAGQQWPHVARPVVYDPNSSSGRRTVGRCATLTDTQQLSGGPSDQSPATVTKVNEVNALPTSPVCASSFLSSYGLQFSGVQCGSTPYDFISQAKATPSDTASGVASASLSFTVTC